MLFTQVARILDLFSVYLFLREKERAEEGQRERETQNRKQAPGSEPSAQSLMRGSNSRTARSWPGWSRTLNRLRLPGAPKINKLIKKKKMCCPGSVVCWQHSVVSSLRHYFNYREPQHPRPHLFWEAHLQQLVNKKKKRPDHLKPTLSQSQLPGKSTLWQLLPGRFQ